MERRLKAEPALASYRYVPRDEALQQLQRGGLGDVLGGLSVNPLPDAFVAAPRGEDPAVFERLAETMRSWPKVAHVQLDSAWVKRLHALLGLGRSAVMMLAGLLGFALVIVTFNTIRLQILTQRPEIEVSRLLGATDPFGATNLASSRGASIVKRTASPSSSRPLIPAVPSTWPETI